MNGCLDYVPVYKCFETWFFTQRSQTFMVNEWVKFYMNGCLGSLCIYVYFEAFFFRQFFLKKPFSSFDFNRVVGF